MLGRQKCVTVHPAFLGRSPPAASLTTAGGPEVGLVEVQPSGRSTSHRMVFVEGSVRESGLPRKPTHGTFPGPVTGGSESPRGGGVSAFKGLLIRIGVGRLSGQGWFCHM